MGSTTRKDATGQAIDGARRIRRRTAVAVVGGVFVGVIVACNDDGSATPLSPFRNVTPFEVQPSCGKPGDTVTVFPNRDGFERVQPGCDGDDSFAVRFSPNIDVPASSVTKEGDGRCSVTATVPAGATTGPLSVALTLGADRSTQTSARPFTIPCPEEPDSGGPHIDPTDAGDGGGGDAEVDAGPCVPAGTAAGPPTGGPSESSVCRKGELGWAGTNLGDVRNCFELGGTVLSSGAKAWATIIPANFPPGDYTLTLHAPGGTASAPFTVKDGLAPSVTNMSTMAAPAGTEITIQGEGFEGVPYLTFTPNDTTQSSANATIKTNTGTVMTADVPSVTPGPARITLYSSGCGIYRVQDFVVQ